MVTRIFQVNAFTDKLFSGNPAGVCILSEPKSGEWLQSVAKELNFAETAFLLGEGDGFRLRWFSPATEIDLCGHATLASAHILWELGHLKPEHAARFATRSGLITATKKNDWIEIDLPADPAREVKKTDLIANALGRVPLYVGKNRFDYLAEVETEKTLRELKPDLSLIKKIAPRGLIVTSLAESGEYDFALRFFAPAAGIDEDHVTGSAQCCLAVFWKERLNKNEFSAYQASPRGGFMRVSVAGERVAVRGRAVTFLSGDIEL